MIKPFNRKNVFLIFEISPWIDNICSYMNLEPPFRLIVQISNHELHSSLDQQDRFVPSVNLSYHGIAMNAIF